MKLVFYSGGQSRKNKALHQALADLTDRKSRKSFTYLPFCADGAEPFFRRAVRRYQPYGFTRFHFLAVDSKPDPSEIRRALESDVIYLAGGNTFYFLKHLRSSGLLSKLRSYVVDGGVLAGLSAGGLIMTPSIDLAGFPPWDADQNEVSLKDLRALSLVNFEFFPHFKKSPRLVSALRRYSKSNHAPILTAQDGGGIVVDGTSTSLLGKINLLNRGEFYEMTSG